MWFDLSTIGGALDVYSTLRLKLEGLDFERFSTLFELPFSKTRLREETAMSYYPTLKIKIVLISC